MPRFLIYCVNGFLLILVFIGVPAITGEQVGALQVSSPPKAHLLTFWGLSLAAAGNAAAALGLVKDRRTRTLCAQWALAFGVLLAVEFAWVRGYLNFNWLKQALLWLQQAFSR